MLHLFYLDELVRITSLHGERSKNHIDYGGSGHNRNVLWHDLVPGRHDLGTQNISEGKLEIEPSKISADQLRVSSI